MKKLVGNFKKLSKNQKKKFVLLSPFILIAAIIDWMIKLGAIVMEFVYRRYKELIAISIVSVMVLLMWVSQLFGQTVPIYCGKNTEQAEEYVYLYCHEMSNNFIVAEDGRVNGFVNANKKNIERILDVISRNEIENCDEIAECLNEFKKGDYSSAVWLHNYCWMKLHGEVGYAIDLKEEYK